MIFGYCQYHQNQTFERPDQPKKWWFENYFYAKINTKLLLYLYQIFIFLLSHLPFFLHFFFSFMENLFKKHSIPLEKLEKLEISGDFFFIRNFWQRLSQEPLFTLRKTSLESHNPQACITLIIPNSEPWHARMLTRCNFRSDSPMLLQLIDICVKMIFICFVHLFEKASIQLSD